MSPKNYDGFFSSLPHPRSVDTSIENPGCIIQPGFKHIVYPNISPFYIILLYKA